MPWPTDIAPAAYFFQSFYGEWIAFVDKHGAGQLNYWSPDGKTFYQLHSTGYGGGPSFEEPHSQKHGHIGFAGPNLVMTVEGASDEPVFVLSARPDEICVVPLPVVPIVRGLYLLRDGQMICVMDDKYKPDDDVTVRMFLGPPERMLGLPIVKEGQRAFFEIQHLWRVSIDGPWNVVGGYLLQELKIEDYEVKTLPDHLEVART